MHRNFDSKMIKSKAEANETTDKAASEPKKKVYVAKTSKAAKSTNKSSVGRLQSRK